MKLILDFYLYILHEELFNSYLNSFNKILCTPFPTSFQFSSLQVIVQKWQKVSYGIFSQINYNKRPLCHASEL